jgi:hypothetical protein
MTARTIGKALGDYAITGAASMLVVSRQGEKPSAQDLAAQYRLRGTRWAVLSEVQKGARMDEALMKQLTGGDEIQAKLMGQNPIDFAPSHSLIMLANDLPRVDPDAKAVWDRLRVAPFTVDFSGREDKSIEELLESELEGVLAWCVEGLRDPGQQPAREGEEPQNAEIPVNTRNCADPVGSSDTSDTTPSHSRESWYIEMTGRSVTSVTGPEHDPIKTASSPLAGLMAGPVVAPNDVPGGSVGQDQETTPSPVLAGPEAGPEAVPGSLPDLDSYGLPERDRA